MFFFSPKSQCLGVSKFGGNNSLRNARLSVSLCFYSVEILRPTSDITSALGVHGWTSSRGGESGSKFRVGFRSLLFVTAGESFASVLLLARSRSTSFLVPPCCFCSLLLDLLSPGNLLFWVSPGCSGCQDCPSCLPWTHPISASTSSQNARMGDKRSWIKGQHSSATGWSNFASSSELLLATLAFSACTWSLPAHQSNVPALLLPAQTQLSHLASPILNSGSDSPLPRNQDTLGSSVLSAAPWQLAVGNWGPKAELACHYLHTRSHLNTPPPSPPTPTPHSRAKVRQLHGSLIPHGIREQYDFGEQISWNNYYMRGKIEHCLGIIGLLVLRIYILLLSIYTAEFTRIK